MAFEVFKKIPRLFRECTITEKIDGTNGQILIGIPGIDVVHASTDQWFDPLVMVGDVAVWAGSRNRWIYAEQSKDNSGFARWVLDRAAQLVEILGPGRHYGEFWGSGIQRKYGLTGNDKRFSLFNTDKWLPVLKQRELGGLPIPAGLGVVPVLYEGQFLTREVEDQIFRLRTFGSLCVPGFMDPEGVVVYHHAAKSYFKVTVKDDEKPKGSTE